MKTGFSRICINPPLGTPMVGYYEQRRAQRIHDDLFVSALALDDGARRAVFLTVDLCLLSTEQCNGFRAELASFTGLPREAIFLHCSHTHTGPTVGDDKFSGLPGNREYDRAFLDALCRAARESLEDLSESEFSYAEGKAEGLGFVRRYRMKDGSVRTNPGVDHPEILCALGKANDAVKMIRIDREGRDSLVLVHYGLHADCVGGEEISGDWPGVVRDVVERTLDHTKCLFLLGSQGDVNHINVHPTPGERRGLCYDSFDGVPRGFEYASHIGRRVAGAVLGLYGTAEPFAADALAYANGTVSIPSNQENHRLEEAKKIKALYEAGRANELPYEEMERTTVVATAVRICELENGPDHFDFTLSALKIGDLILAGLPGECFAEIGRTIESSHGDQRIVVCCLTNGGDSYFPTSSAYDEGGYETGTSRLKKGGDRILAQGIDALITQLNG